MNAVKSPAVKAYELDKAKNKEQENKGEAGPGPRGYVSSLRSGLAIQHVGGRSAASKRTAKAGRIS